jgi:hypothetical protein
MQTNEEIIQEQKAEDKPITLILDCPITGRTVITHMNEEQLDMFIASCEREQKSELRELVRQVNPNPKANILSEEERYFYD